MRAVSGVAPDVSGVRTGAFLRPGPSLSASPLPRIVDDVDQDRQVQLVNGTTERPGQGIRIKAHGQRLIALGHDAAAQQPDQVPQVGAAGPRVRQHHRAHVREN